MMDSLNFLREFELSENHYLGSYDPTADHHPQDDNNACIEFDLFMQILDEHNVPDSAKKGVTRRWEKGSLEYAEQREPNKMKNEVAVDGAVEKRKILQEDATESENKWPRRKRFKRGSLEYAQRQELNKIKNRIAAARTFDKVKNHILELERKAIRLRRHNDNRRELLTHWAGPNAFDGFRPSTRTFSGPL